MELNKLPSMTDQITSEVVKTISSIYDVPKVSKKTRIAPTIFSVCKQPELQTAQEISGLIFAPTQNLSFIYPQVQF